MTDRGLYQTAESLYSTEGGDAVRLELPASGRFVRLARLLASGVAAAAGFDVDAVEDFRIAVDEVCTGLVEAAPGATMELDFHARQGAVVLFASVPIRLQAVAPPEAAPTGLERDDLSAQILGVVVDAWERTVDDGAIRYRLPKFHRPETD
jgi:hypothetical protein